MDPKEIRWSTNHESLDVWNLNPALHHEKTGKIQQELLASGAKLKGKVSARCLSVSVREEKREVSATQLSEV